MRQPIPSETIPINANNLSDLLDQIDNIQGKIGLGVGKKGLDLLLLCDRVDERFRLLEQQGNEVKAEKAQFEHVTETYRKQAWQFIREVGGLREIEQLREKTQPRSENWWWWPERIVKDQRLTSFKGYLRNLLILASVILVVVVAYQLFFKPDPKVIAVMDAGQNAQLSMSDGNPDKALADIETGLAISPKDPDLLMLKGCILSLNTAKTAEAKAVFDQAEMVINSRELFLMNRAQTYFMIGQLELSKADAQAAIDVNPNSAKAYLILGQDLESLADQTGAYAAYQKASDLGGDDPTTVAQARIKMGMLLQSMGLFPSTQDVTTTTPTP
jgi:tetratricopeptide (TPR) repeat protein